MQVQVQMPVLASGTPSAVREEEWKRRSPSIEIHRWNGPPVPCSRVDLDPHLKPRLGLIEMESQVVPEAEREKEGRKED